MELDASRQFGFENFFLITLDSCRFDAFNMAKTPNLSEQCTFLETKSQATFTLPSHVAMLAGNFPSTNANVPYYNRLVKYLCFIRGGTRTVDTYVEFESGTRTIANGFGSLGYKTLCIGAVEWFNNPILTDPFDQSIVTGIHLERQLDLLFDGLKENGKPHFVLLNIGETHDPFLFGGRVDADRLAPKFREGEAKYFQPQLLQKQVECCEFIDRHLVSLFEWASKQHRDSIFIVCGDHGECMGEDALFGHGFHHDKVLSVPMGIFLIEGATRVI
ncbi:MAG: sulfatase-like hydrolase/transferase [Pseudomonadota bacterium]